jgi:hypothetical protein
LNGITRDDLHLAEELGLPVIERRITRDEFYIADEAFFTGTAAEVTPIRELDNRPIGRHPGPGYAEAAGNVLRRRQRSKSQVSVLAHARGERDGDRRRCGSRVPGDGAGANDR